MKLLTNKFRIGIFVASLGLIGACTDSNKTVISPLQEELRREGFRGSGLHSIKVEDKLSSRGDYNDIREDAIKPEFTSSYKTTCVDDWSCAGNWIYLEKLQRKRMSGKNN